MLFRVLVALIVAVSVPVQGLAAVSGGICMALNGHDAGHGQAAAAAHDHQHEQQHEHGSGDAHAGNSHCAPCVSCCAAVAIAPTDKYLLPEAPPIAAFAALQYWFAGIVPDNPERPPLAL